MDIKLIVKALREQVNELVIASFAEPPASYERGYKAGAAIALTVLAAQMEDGDTPDISEDFGISLNMSTMNSVEKN